MEETRRKGKKGGGGKERDRQKGEKDGGRRKGERRGKEEGSGETGVKNNREMRYKERDEERP